MFLYAARRQKGRSKGHGGGRELACLFAFDMPIKSSCGQLKGTRPCHHEFSIFRSRPGSDLHLETDGRDDGKTVYEEQFQRRFKVAALEIKASVTFTIHC